MKLQNTHILKNTAQNFQKLKSSQRKKMRKKKKKRERKGGETMKEKQITQKTTISLTRSCSPAAGDTGRVE